MVSRSPTASAIAGSARAVEGTPSSCRPPWLETTMPSTPQSAAARASSGSRMPLITNLPGHCARRPSTSFQVRVASKLLPTISGSRAGWSARRTDGRHCRASAAAPDAHVPGPARACPSPAAAGAAGCAGPAAHAGRNGRRGSASRGRAGRR